MNRRQLVLAFIATLACGCRTEWTRFDSDRCGLAARFPEEASEQPWGLATSGATAGGALIDTPSTNPAKPWFVIYCVYVMDGADHGAIRRALENEIAAGGTQVAWRDARVGRHKGSEMALRVGGRERRVRFVAVPGRIIAASAPRDGSRSDERFFAGIDIREAFVVPDGKRLAR